MVMEGEEGGGGGGDADYKRLSDKYSNVTDQGEYTQK